MKHILTLAAPNMRGFFAQWLRWKSQGDLRDGTVLHYVHQCNHTPRWEDVEKDLQAAAQENADTTQWQADATRALQAQWWGLLPGMHRLALEDERLILTLAIGKPLDMLRQTTGRFGQIKLHAGFFEAAHKDACNTPWRSIASALRPLCAHNTQLLCAWPEQMYGANAHGWQHVLSSDGWVVQDDAETPSVFAEVAARHKHIQRWRYAPHWLPKPTITQPQSRTAVVIGAGLAGCATAYSLARRGWQVTVLDAGDAPGAGASGLAVGLIVPHSSADDTRISQVIRAGIRCSLQRAQALLHAGQDWAQSGVLEHCVQGQSKLPRHWPADAQHAATADNALHDPACAAAPDWSSPATAQQVQQAQLPPDAVALWHPRAAWVKPPQLLAALLAHPRIRFVGGQRIAAIAKAATPHAPSDAAAQPLWQVLDANQHVLAQAPLLVLAAGFGCRALLQTVCQPPDVPDGSSSASSAAPFGMALNALRGQVAWGWHADKADASLPPFPVNGKGSMAAHIPFAHAGRSGTVWVSGSTFTRGDTDAAPRENDIPDILAKLRVLHPHAANVLHTRFEQGQVQSWAGIRATLPDRLPAVGTVSPDPQWHGLHVCCGLGARGLALAMLCGELLAARLHDEPLPAGRKLAAMLEASRFQAKG